MVNTARSQTVVLEGNNDLDVKKFGYIDAPRVESEWEPLPSFCVGKRAFLGITQQRKVSKILQIGIELRFVIWERR